MSNWTMADIMARMKENEDFGSRNAGNRDVIGKLPDKIKPDTGKSKVLKLYEEYKDGAEDREEEEIQSDLASWWRYWWDFYPLLKYCHAVPNGGKRPISVARKMKAEGQEPGVPDVYVMYPNHGYHTLIIEHKRKHGDKLKYPRKEQREWLNRLASVGHHVCVSWSTTASKQIIAAHLELPDEVLAI